MILNIDFTGTWDNEDINLDDLYDLDWVLDEEDMTEAIKVEVCRLAIEHGVGFDQVQPDHIEDDNGYELSVWARNDLSWVEEVAKFAFYILSEPSYVDQGMYFAYVDNESWRQFDFDHMKRIEDEFSQEFDGDYEDWARERLSILGESLPEHLESYFNYREYGETEIENDYSVIEWGDTTYLFHK